MKIEKIYSIVVVTNEGEKTIRFDHHGIDFKKVPSIVIRDGKKKMIELLLD